MCLDQDFFEVMFCCCKQHSYHVPLETTVCAVYMIQQLLVPFGCTVL
jgi:hypothetical protein